LQPLRNSGCDFAIGQLCINCHQRAKYSPLEAIYHYNRLFLDLNELKRDYC
jgi:hypothetical protein